MISKLENNEIKIKVDTQGAQLQKLILKEDQKNYLWHGDSKYWGRRAPVLFPIVGRLKNDKYLYNGQEYQMTQHGFARDNEFELVDQDKNFLTYALEENRETLKKYPFRFRLEIKYTIKENSLAVTYRVINQDQKDMYFSIGAHPAFYWPLAENESKADYYLEFEKEENADKYLLDSGLLNNEKVKVLSNSKILELQPDIFKDDALVFKDLKSEKITLKSRKSNREVQVEFNNFPYLGIWSQSAAAPFICIEPWQGIADSVNSSGKLEEKEGIKRLKAGGIFKCTHTITID
ncbi:galactose mutarotase-like enzyme [Halanaerobium saccharolyticum]|uniref:Galactose mutarotase-like enzyme n=1 Tax=Halanaerobium saccharolyticum TaxID=43595 RepID=A0A4R7YN61_9FIRM|nr:aldose 1-epimerase family protein [Halanaerobium saccharolyticum]RAK05179.1 galactose mutarotase-like enzyme [Halanaerobium saccharolyticum]TDV99010.1 galactose mutarotase-like enzyme [Halanaerobium saccharolyticum]TDX51701.1 galactose mutarotase-like enzyme [Halanaerobium saccharolyticum]